MPYEVSMSGGSPWGFRVAGGPFAGKPTTISRITPGGKAAQANVMQGDILIAVNGFSVNHFDLPQLMNMIKCTGWTLHLTLISQDEIALVKKKRKPETNITDATDIERPSSRILRSSCSNPPDTEQTCSQESRLSDCKVEVTVEETTNEITELEESKDHREEDCEDNQNLKMNDKICSNSGSKSTDPSDPPVEHPSPKPRKMRNVEKHNEDSSKALNEEVSEPQELQEKKKMPDFVRRQLKPPKPLPTFKPQVYWLHDKLRLSSKRQNGLKDPGHNLKIAASAYPSRKIEIEGPLSATIFHSQYNTPVGMYSPNQIANTLVNTAAATGAKVSDPTVFGDNDVDVDRSTAVYKMVHNTDRPPSAPAQSPSIQILDALLEHGREIPLKGL